jgi:hypothetical protein
MVLGLLEGEGGVQRVPGLGLTARRVQGRGKCRGT